MSEKDKRMLPPFDGQPLSSEDMYTHLPYVKDISLCTPETIRLVSGNVIKYYTVEQKDPVTVDSNAESDRLTQLSHDEVARKYAESIADQEDSLADITESAADLAAKLTEDSEPDIMEAGSPSEEDTAEAPEQESAEPELTDAFAGYNEDEEDEFDFSFLK